MDRAALTAAHQNYNKNSPPAFSPDGRFVVFLAPQAGFMIVNLMLEPVNQCRLPSLYFAAQCYFHVGGEHVCVCFSSARFCTRTPAEICARAIVPASYFTMQMCICIGGASQALLPCNEHQLDMGIREF